MAHYPLDDGNYRSPAHGGEQHLRSYRFVRSSGKRRPALTAFYRVNSYLKDVIQSIADVKLRRMHHELELRGVRMDGADEAWIPRSLREGNRRR